MYVQLGGIRKADRKTTGKETETLTASIGEVVSLSKGWQMNRGLFIILGEVIVILTKYKRYRYEKFTKGISKSSGLKRKIRR